MFIISSVFTILGVDLWFSLRRTPRSVIFRKIYQVDSVCLRVFFFTSFVYASFFSFSVWMLRKFENWKGVSGIWIIRLHFWNSRTLVFSCKFWVCADFLAQYQTEGTLVIFMTLTNFSWLLNNHYLDQYLDTRKS